MDHLRAGRRLRLRGAEPRAQEAGEIMPVEADDQVGLPEEARFLVARTIADRRQDMGRVFGREGGGVVGRGQNERARGLGQTHARVPFGLAARAAPDEDAG